MAKIATQLIVIKINKLVKDSESDSLELLDDSGIDDLSAIVQELVKDTGVIVEVEKE